MSNPPLAPSDVEYLFRAIRTDTASIRNRLFSLLRNFDGSESLGISGDLDEAIGYLTNVAAHVERARKKAIPHVMPHRQHAGELER